MGSRFVSAVAFYGPKAGPLRDLLAGTQALIAEYVGDDFRAYSPEQVHATLIALNGVRDPGTGAVLNEYLLEHDGVRREVDLPRVMDILARRFSTPLRVRIGGLRANQELPFTSRGQHLAERTFSVQDQAFVLMGWPAESLAGAGRPLDELRREMNAAGVRHRYHVRATDVDPALTRRPKIEVSLQHPPLNLAPLLVDVPLELSVVAGERRVRAEVLLHRVHLLVGAGKNVRGRRLAVGCSHEEVLLPVRGWHRERTRG